MVICPVAYEGKQLINEVRTLSYMRDLILIIVSLFFFNLTCLAQGKDTIIERKWAVSITTVLLPLPVRNVGIQPGIEYRISKKVSLLSEVTFQLTGKQKKDSTTADRKYFRIKPEIRYLFSPHKNKSGNILYQSYIGLQFSYTNRNFTNFKNGYYFDDSPRDSAYFFSQSKIKSPIKTISFQSGVIINVAKRLYTDLFFGIGLRFINTSFSDITNLRKGKAPTKFIAPFESYKYLGNISRIHFNGGLRLLYKLGTLK